MTIRILKRERGPMRAKVLEINLSRKSVRTRSYGESVLRTCFGGSGLAIKMAMDRPGPFDPLDPRSPLMFVVGLLTGTPAPTAARTSVCARSPLTGIWGESSAGGYWGPELRFAGLLGLVVTGKAAAPTYLWVKDGKVEFRNDSGGSVHAVVGKLSFDGPKLIENIRAFIDYVIGLKPAAVRGQYVRGIAISATMSPGVRVAA